MTDLHLDPIVARLGQMHAAAIAEAEILRQQLADVERRLAEVEEANRLLCDRLSEAVPTEVPDG